MTSYTTNQPSLYPVLDTHCRSYDDADVAAIDSPSFQILVGTFEHRPKFAFNLVAPFCHSVTTS